MFGTWLIFEHVRIGCNNFVNQHPGLLNKTAISRRAQTHTHTHTLTQTKPHFVTHTHTHSAYGLFRLICSLPHRPPFKELVRRARGSVLTSYMD